MKVGNFITNINLLKEYMLLKSTATYNLLTIKLTLIKNTEISHNFLIKILRNSDFLLGKGFNDHACE